METYRALTLREIPLSKSDIENRAQTWAAGFGDKVNGGLDALVMVAALEHFCKAARECVLEDATARAAALAANGIHLNAAGVRWIVRQVRTFDYSRDDEHAALLGNEKISIAERKHREEILRMTGEAATVSVKESVAITLAK